MVTSMDMIVVKIYEGILGWIMTCLNECKRYCCIVIHVNQHGVLYLEQSITIHRCSSSIKLIAEHDMMHLCCKYSYPMSSVSRKVAMCL
jgi:hypothetical protein